MSGGWGEGLGGVRREGGKQQSRGQPSLGDHNENKGAVVASGEAQFSQALNPGQAFDLR